MFPNEMLIKSIHVAFAYNGTKPTKVALYCIKGKMMVMGIFWEGEDGGVWDDENAVSMTTIICDLPQQ